MLNSGLPRHPLTVHLVVVAAQVAILRAIIVVLFTANTAQWRTPIFITAVIGALLSVLFTGHASAAVVGLES